MTLITVGVDTELLLRQLRQRLAYVDGRINFHRRREASDNDFIAALAAEALRECHNEQSWLTALFQSVQGVEQGESCHE